jgi:hypothetical protein
MADEDLVINPHPPRPRRPAHEHRLLTFTALIISVVSAFASLWQANVAKQQAAIAEQARRDALDVAAARPKIHISSVNVAFRDHRPPDFFGHTPDEDALVLTLQNIGEVPANNVQVKVAISEPRDGDNIDSAGSSGTTISLPPIGSNGEARFGLGIAKYLPYAFNLHVFGTVRYSGEDGKPAAPLPFCYLMPVEPPDRYFSGSISSCLKHQNDPFLNGCPAGLAAQSKAH